MAVEEIAAVVTDLKNRRVQSPLPEDHTLHTAALDVIVDPVIVDCTGIYRSIQAIFDTGKAIYNYEDHPCIAPPFEEAAYCYVNQHGNVNVMHASALVGEDMPRWESFADDHTIDWERVRWVLRVFVWVGGRGDSGRRALPTTGPAHLWHYAVYDDGEPADLQWTHLLHEHPLEMWDMEQLVLLGALNFLNCRNIELVEATTTRPERRRMQRAGTDDIKVKTIMVYPAGKSRASTKGVDVGGSPLTSVRGHFASYGPQYGKGLLFGKYEGRFFIPQHVRGNIDTGEKPDYKLVPK